jgi:murein DD-endopeptidase MepM/ murein hydrolase activator NlpD
VNVNNVGEVVRLKSDTTTESVRLPSTSLGPGKPDTTSGGPSREQITRLAAEFESMLMLQMLKEMRKSGSWDDQSEGRNDDGFGTQTMLETVDVELANHLAKVQGFGLAKQMLRAFESAAGAASHPVEKGAAAAPIVEAGLQTRLPVDDAALEMPDGKVTSGFGWRRDPLTGAARFHQGIDVRAAYGQDVASAGPGRVVSARSEGAYGETVVIEHAGGIRTRYAHLSTMLVTPGDEVAAGQVIGRAGRSGRATGTHLHFEVTQADGDRVDPASFERFKAKATVADLTVGRFPGQESRTE